MNDLSAKRLQEILDVIFRIFEVNVATGLTKEGVAIRSQDPRVDAANIGTVRAHAIGDNPQ